MKKRPIVVIGSTKIANIPITLITKNKVPDCIELPKIN
jgi:hypothetical protein